LAIALLLFEVIIAVFVKDQFFRPFVGDFLVVILLYSTSRALFSFSSLQTAVGVLLIAYCIEFFQYIEILEVLNIKRNVVLDLVFGTQFDWTDILAYSLGVAIILAMDNLILKTYIKSLVTRNKE